MREITIGPASLARFGTTALAVALACAATGAYASFASVVINDFSFTSSADPSFFVFAPTDTRNQSWFLFAEDTPGLTVTNSNSVPNWSNVTQAATNARTRATVASSVVTDPLTQVPLPAFTLTANATALAPGQVNTALGNMLSSGSLCLWDSNTNFDGTSASCTGSGSLTFTLNYDLILTPTSGKQRKNAPTLPRSGQNSWILVSVSSKRTRRRVNQRIVPVWWYRRLARIGCTSASADS